MFWFSALYLLGTVIALLLPMQPVHRQLVYRWPGPDVPGTRASWAAALG